MSSDSTETSTVETELQSVRFVGPATAAALASEGCDATAITDKQLSYRLMVEAGVNPGVAAKIRREHSLPWSFDTGGDLDRRSAQVRGLGTAEAEWVAASAGDWEAETDLSGSDEAAATEDSDDAGDVADADHEASADRTPWPTHGEGTGETATAEAATAATDGSGDAAGAEAAWRARSSPTPVIELEAVDAAAADRLAEAGITSVRSLATADPARIADVLNLPSEAVEAWYRAARAAADSPQ